MELTTRSNYRYIVYFTSPEGSRVVSGIKDYMEARKIVLAHIQAGHLIDAKILYRGKLVGYYTKKEGFREFMGKLAQLQAENKPEQTPFVDKSFLANIGEEFTIIGIRKAPSKLTGNHQWMLEVEFAKDVEKRYEHLLQVKMTLSLDGDKARDATIGQLNTTDLPYGPCYLAKEGRYFIVREVEENEPQPTQKPAGKAKKNAGFTGV